MHETHLQKYRDHAATRAQTTTHNARVSEVNDRLHALRRQLKDLRGEGIAAREVGKRLELDPEADIDQNQPGATAPAAYDTIFDKAAESDFGPAGADARAVAHAKNAPAGHITIERITRPNGKQWHTAYFSDGKGNFASQTIGAELAATRKELEAQRDKSLAEKARQQETADAARSKYRAEEQAAVQANGFSVGSKFGRIKTQAGDTYTGGEITSLSDEGIEIKAKRGGKDITLKTDAKSLAGMIERAGGQEKTSRRSDDFSKSKPKALQERDRKIAEKQNPQHIEGNKAEPATTAVIADSIRKSAANTALDLREAKAALLKQIDEAIAAAPDRAQITNAQDTELKAAAKQVEDLHFAFVRNQAKKEDLAAADTRLKAAQAAAGMLTFDVPGDGSFRVVNSKEKLQEFRKKIAATSAFNGATSTKDKKPAAIGTSPLTAISDMIQDGELTAAYELAKSIGKPFRFGTGAEVPFAYYDTKEIEINGTKAFVGRLVKTGDEARKNPVWRVIDIQSGLGLGTGANAVKAEADARAMLKGKSEADIQAARDRQTKTADQETLDNAWLEAAPGIEDEIIAQKEREAAAEARRRKLERMAPEERRRFLDAEKRGEDPDQAAGRLPANVQKAIDSDPRIKALHDGGMDALRVVQAAKELKEGDDSLVRDLARINSITLPVADKQKAPALAARDEKIAAKAAEQAGADRDSFILERLNPETGKMDPVTFRRGEYVRANISNTQFTQGEIEGISHAKREAKVDGLWYEFGRIYKAERPASAEKPTVPMSSVVDAVNAKHGEGLTDADRILAVRDVDDFVTRLRNGEVSPEEFKATFQALLKSESRIAEDLAELKKDEILAKGGPVFAYRYKSEKKADVIAQLYDQMLMQFHIGSGALSYVLGGGVSYRQSKVHALAKMVEATTEADLKAFSEKIAEAKTERDEKSAKMDEAIQDPKTLGDYSILLHSKMDGGKTFTQARLELKPEQQAAYDDLAATKTRTERLAKKLEDRTEMRVAGQVVDGKIIETRHTQKGHDLFVVQLAERVSREDYDTLNVNAKKLGGYYSSYRGRGAVPGFTFTDRAQAEAFVKLAQGDTAAAQEAAKARRTAFDDDKSQSAAERLTTMAEALEEQADESMAADRKTNTARRARFAAAADANARAKHAMAETMRNIAASITEGRAKFLDRVRQKVQIELLSQLARNARDAALRADPEFDKLPYDKREAARQAPPTADQMAHAEWPSFTAYRSDLANLGRHLLEIEGFKKIGQAIMKVADDTSDAYLKFAKDNISKVSPFSVKGTGERAAFKSKAEAEAAISRSGYKGKAIPLPIKRNEVLIAYSASEAQRLGLWDGDADKKITLNAEFGSELVEKAGKANRYRTKIDIPWQFETAKQRRDVLARMGIENPAEMRAALREYVNLSIAPKPADKIREMERAMIGRRKDGLDFFPTPSNQAQEMVDVADIQPGMSVYEPHAGMGHIADQIREAGFEPDVGELSGDRRELLEAKGYNLVSHDFLDMTLADTPDGKGYDRIIMNPPFSDRRDAQHVMHAYDLLKPGGRLVAIMGEGAFFGQDKRAQEFRDWLDQAKGTSEKLAEGTFQDPSLPVTTGVNARMVVIDKPKADENLLYSRERIDSDDPLVNLYSDIASHEDAFRLPDSKSKSLKGVLSDLAPGAAIEDISERADIGEYAGNEDWRRVHRVSEIRMPNESEYFALVFETTDKKVWLDISNWKLGKSGTEVYQAVATYAHNAGLQFIGDPMGLSADAAYRRLEHMISSTLRHGTTEHLAPHPRQTAHDRLLGDRIQPLDWRPGDDAHNLREMLAASYYNVKQAIPELDDVSYNFAAGRFEAAADSPIRKAGGASVRASEGNAAVSDVRDHAAADGESSVRPGDRSESDRGAAGPGTVPVHVQASGELGHVDAVPFTDANFDALAERVRGRVRLERASAGGDSAPPFGVRAIKRAVLTASILRSAGSQGGRVLLDRVSAGVLQRLSPQLKKLLYRQDTPQAGSQADQRLIEQVRAGATATELLSTIADHSADPDYRTMARHFLKLGINSSVEIGQLNAQQFAVQNRDRMSFSAAYSPKRDAVILFGQDNVERNLIHEFTHAATYRALRKNGLAATQMKALYQHVKQAGALDGLYGLENVDEFVAEAFSNPEFQRHLQAITQMPEGSRLKNIWQKFVSIIRQALGLPVDTINALEQAIRLGTDLMQENAGKDRDGNETLLGNVRDTGTVGGAFDMLRSAKTLDDTTKALKALAASDRKFSLWDRTIGTQFHKATKDADFKRVFDAYNQQTNDTAHYAIEAERFAPGVLQRLDSLKDIGRALTNSGARYKADLAAVSKALFANIAGKQGVQQKVFTDEELRSEYKLSDLQIDMYRQVRKAVDTSIDRLAQTTIASMGQAVGLDIRELRNLSLEDTARAVKAWTEDGAIGKNVAGMTRDDNLHERIDALVEHAQFLKAQGYMPAMRFGEYAVTVHDAAGAPLHFEMFESQLAANIAANKLAKQYPGKRIEKSVLNPDQYALFKGVSPETVELFAKFSGMDKNEAFQDYIALAKSARSTMKRMLERQGVAGFSEDATRVLASFITSNARQSSLNMNTGAINSALASPSLARKGDVQREAQKLHEYMANPREEAQQVRGFLFMHFLGGSVASAVTNLTQPVLQTAPYLQQYAGGKVVGIMTAAAKMAASGKIENAELKAAMARAAADGITDPHEIHNLMADASGSTLGSSLRARALTKAWGSFFSLSEAYNRRLTFLAAYQTAQQMGKKALQAKGFDDAYQFASRAIIETQGLYAKTNRPNWARGAIGATLFTFKQFSISYIEMINRLPRQQKLLALGILVLAAGVQGLPFADDLEDLIDTIGQTMGFNTNSKKALRRALEGAFGKDLGEILNQGFSSKTGIDMSGRLGLGNLVPGTALFKMSEKDKTRGIAEFAGPLGSVLTSFQRAFTKLQAGKTLGKTGALAELAPVSVKNLLQGAEMAQTGVYRDTQGRKVQDVDVLDSVIKALGFQPQAVAEESGRIREMMQDKGLHDAVKSGIVDRMVSATVEGDQEAMQKARATLQAWNQHNPEAPIRIPATELRKRLIAMRQSREERFLKSTPKAQRNEARAELQN